MATVSYSVPNAVEEAFNRAFAGKNKSAVIAALMQRAVEEEVAREQRMRAVSELLALRASEPPVPEAEVDAAREEVRQ